MYNIYIYILYIYTTIPIGKTSTVRLVSKSLGLTTLQQNSIDTRNKKKIDFLLTSMTGNKSIREYFGDRSELNES